MTFQLFVEETKITDRFAPDITDQDDPYVLVDVGKVDQAWKKSGSGYVGSTGEGGIAGRYDRFEKFWKEGHTIVAPVISVRENGAVEFTNGRHRFAYLRDQGMKRIPVSMDTEYLKLAKKFNLVVKVLPKKKGIGHSYGKASGKS